MRLIDIFISVWLILGIVLGIILGVTGTLVLINWIKEMRDDE